ncbi:MAG: helicase C-terminal domain-containing protein, partial [Actinomycetota bacterium]|nr:helicase C-terminal domain-containing protein [Actinomycetota bacterium]
DSDRTYLTEDRSDVAPLPGSVQIAFCDRGTPKPDGSWTVYSAIKDELIERGVAAEHVRFIHDAKTPSQRLKLFDDCKTGKVRVLIGSTERMGTGVNVQTRLAALHHIDVPWRPADLEQREGRILRQGNQNAEVDIFQYVTAGTTDTVMWGKVETKARFIDEYKMGQLSNTDDLGEIDSESLTEAAAATKAAATGDARFITMVELDDEVTKLAALEAAHRDTQSHARRRVGALDREIPATEAQIDRLAAITAAIEQWDTNGRPFAVLDGRGNSATLDERPERSAALTERARDTYFALKGRGASDYRPIAAFPETGIRLDMSRSIEGDMVYMRLSGPALSTPEYLSSSDATLFTTPASPAAAAGLATRVENAYARLATLPEKLTHDIAEATRERDILLPRLEGQFEHAEVLRDKRVELEQIKTAIAAEARTPEALAAREAAEQRLREAGREPGWSLQWNPTNHMVAEAGLSTREDYRVAAQRIEAHRARQYAAEQMTPAQRAAAIASRGIPRISPRTGAAAAPPPHGAAARRHDTDRTHQPDGPAR